MATSPYCLSIVSDVHCVQDKKSELFYRKYVKYLVGHLSSIALGHPSIYVARARWRISHRNGDVSLGRSLGLNGLQMNQMRMFES